MASRVWGYSMRQNGRYDFSTAKVERGVCLKYPSSVLTTPAPLAGYITVSPDRLVNIPRIPKVTRDEQRQHYAYMCTAYKLTYTVKSYIRHLFQSIDLNACF